MKAVLTGVVRLVADNPGSMTLSGTCTYLLGTRRVTIVDPGPSGPAQQMQLGRAVADRPVEAILLTHAHFDHSGAATWAGEEFSAPILGSAATLERVGIDGRPLADAEPIAAGDLGESLAGLHTPGHSRDHVCYALEERRAVFTGDLVLGTGTSAILFPDGDVTEYLASLERLIAMAPATLLPGHGPVVDDATRRLREYVAHRLDREHQILTAVRARADSLAAIRKQVYGSLAPGLEAAAELSICAHLRRLTENGSQGPARPELTEEDLAARLRVLLDKCNCTWGEGPAIDH